MTQTSLPSTPSEAELLRDLQERHELVSAAERPLRPVKVTLPLPPDPTPEELEQRQAAYEAERRRVFREQCEMEWRSFIGRRGKRYAECQLENFQAESDKQREVLKQLTEYLDHFGVNVQQGRGVVLFGSTGTGKDHLLAALCRFAIRRRGMSVTWHNGLDLYASIRSAIHRDEEADAVNRLSHVGILAISDAIPPAGELTEYQASVLFRVLDERYSHMRPVWMTLNVASADEAKSRLTAPIVDRLRDCCLTLHCNWESYRGKP